MDKGNERICTYGCIKVSQDVADVSSVIESIMSNNALHMYEHIRSPKTI